MSCAPLTGPSSEKAYRYGSKCLPTPKAFSASFRTLTTRYMPTLYALPCLHATCHTPSRRLSDIRQLQHKSIHTCRQDLSALQELLAQLTQQRLSKNDILMGFVWVLRCVLSGDPLPGQVRVQCQTAGPLPCLDGEACTL